MSPTHSWLCGVVESVGCEYKIGKTRITLLKFGPPVFRMSTEICVSHYGKMALGQHVLEQKLPITDPPPPKVCVSGFWTVEGNRKFVSAIMKKWINGSSSPKRHLRVKFPITDPLKFGSLVFQVSKEMENLCLSL